VHPVGTPIGSRIFTFARIDEPAASVGDANVIGNVFPRR
jgi:hypothetical protein